MAEQSEGRFSGVRSPGDRSRDESRGILLSVVTERADSLVKLFYDTLLADEAASAFLSHSTVHNRLSLSLRNWLLELLHARWDNDPSAFDERQRAIGDVHARIKIPIHLVLQGASLIKEAVSAHLVKLDLPREVLAEAIILLDQRIDYAMRLMSQAYVSGMARRAQLDEAFKLFALGQDITLERESQRAALMEWSQSVLFSLFGSQAGADLKPICSSPFGLWLHHRASVMFQDVPALESIESAMQQVDKVLLPKIEEARATNGPDLTETLGRLQALIEQMKFLLADLFQSVAGLENGRDPLTRTLNRRFLPSILSREISIAGKNGSPFTILMIDVDHFKQINDRWGHSAGDMVLRQVAEAVLDTVRLSDFVFRYGGEEFLVALVETAAEPGFTVAERIREALMSREMHLPDGTHLTVTASIGVAAHEGHPDYAYLIEAADQALYQAKERGRNRTVIAGASPRQPLR
ncbi:diguanylate cyclase [Microvirga sp. M2]|uniref:GGDEF domain-containing protein n=1 Tax=Microvirga sp. M2 TaxID=3073270 RepID=UPI0039C3FBFE